MTNKRLYMDVHVIQVLPPSNINRDDTGSPKTAQYGGVRRARVSSQAWKKAIRDYFDKNSQEFEKSTRSKHIIEHVAKKVRDLDPEIEEKDAITKVEQALTTATEKRREKAVFQ
ncbi:MAG: type I-E CRISPR-associated protein Cas7/Cse4/CasC [Clostridiales bacterium]|nr:type I-E CRISPR-associated protein Cas7/Cse4/CasC [Clostridiales bacterium]